MESTRTSPSQTPSESDDEIWAIVSDKLQIPSHQDPKPLVKSRLRDEVEGVTMGQVGNKLVYANLGGHNFLEDRDEMKQRFNEQSRRFDEISTQLGEHQKRISSLESRVKILTQSSEGYLSIRRRFLDTYKRDIKSMEELKGSKAIQKGNSAAHEGDALGDAEVFNRDQRTDRAIYRELYGLDYTQVIAFHSASDDGSLFLVLNAHATMVARGKHLSDDLKLAFNSFLLKVEEYWLQPPNQEPQTALGSAYYTFWKKHGQQAQI